MIDGNELTENGVGVLGRNASVAVENSICAGAGINLLKTPGGSDLLWERLININGIVEDLINLFGILKFVTVKRADLSRRIVVTRAIGKISTPV